MINDELLCIWSLTFLHTREENMTKLLARWALGVAALVTAVVNLPFKAHRIPLAKAEFGDGDLMAMNCGGDGRECFRLGR